MISMPTVRLLRSSRLLNSMIVLGLIPKRSAMPLRVSPGWMV